MAAARASPGSPGQTHTNDPSSCTGKARTAAPNGTFSWVGTADARPVGGVAEPGVAGDDVVALDASAAERHRAVAAPVLERDRVAVRWCGRARPGAEHAAGQRRAADLVGGGGGVPRVVRYVGAAAPGRDGRGIGHGSRSFPLTRPAPGGRRGTGTRRPSCSPSPPARPASSTESRWSTSPSSTPVSQVPQMPSRHEPSTDTPASRIASKTRLLRPRRSRVTPDRCSTSSKAASSPSCSMAFAANRSRCSAPVRPAGAGGLHDGEQRLRSAAVDQRRRASGEPRIPATSSRPSLVLGHHGDAVAVPGSDARG